MKFQKLYEIYGNENIVRIECPGLSKLIENAGPNSKEIKQYLSNLLAKYQNDEISAVVIGCTHFSFIEDDIQGIVGDTIIFDGRYGIARHIQEVIQGNNMCGDSEGSVDLISTHEDMAYKLLMEKFMSMPLSSEEY
jgi:glutamate racemase